MNKIRNNGEKKTEVKKPEIKTRNRKPGAASTDKPLTNPARRVSSSRRADPENKPNLRTGNRRTAQKKPSGAEAFLRYFKKEAILLSRKLKRPIAWCKRYRYLILIATGILVITLTLVFALSSKPDYQTAAAKLKEDNLNFTAIPSPLPSIAPVITPSPTPTPTPEPTPVKLEPGAVSPEVALLQERLMELDYMEQDEPTELYGPMTKQAIVNFQMKNGLDPDGYCGPVTKEMLFSENAKKYTITVGDKGTDVHEVQKRLNELGYIKSITDYFGTETQAAVKKFQQKNGLSADGTVGARTKEMLYSENVKADAISLGTTGDDVLKLQKRLQSLGYLTTTADGKFGKDTVIAVKRFQERMGLIADGHAGPETIRNLNSGKAQPNAIILGDSGLSVTNVQKRLITLRYLSGKADGYFGSGTEKAVKAFQKNNKLSTDGKIGAQTLQALLSGKAKTASGGSSGSSGGGSGGGNGSTPQAPNETSVSALIQVAKSKLGTRYILGAKGPDAFDCSGFVYWCLNQIGVRQGYMTSSTWAKNSKYPLITKLGSVVAGDIIAFRGHVGIAIGGGQMIDASSGGGKIRITSLSTPYWQRNFICAFRVL